MLSAMSCLEDFAVDHAKPNATDDTTGVTDGEHERDGSGSGWIETDCLIRLLSTKSGTRMVSRRRLLRAASVFGVTGLTGCGTTPRGDGQQNGSENGTGTPDVATSTPTVRDRDYDTIRVPEDHETIQAGVDAASSGDLVLVAADTYDEEVVVSTPGVTIRGRDRNGTVLDGGSSGKTPSG